MLVRQNTTADERKRDINKDLCSDTLDPDGEVRGCSAGCTIAMSDVCPFVSVQLAGAYKEFP